MNKKSAIFFGNYTLFKYLWSNSVCAKW